MQLSVKRKENPAVILPLDALPARDPARIVSLDLDAGLSLRLMEMGFLPDQPVTRVAAAPGGDPLIFLVDGSQIALRRDIARRIRIRR